MLAKLDHVDLASLQVEELLQPPIVVPLTKTVDEMFDFFVKNNARAAAALNEFGGVAGFITINDVLRFIFGPLSHPIVDLDIQQVRPNVFEMPGDMKLGEINRVTNLGIYDPRMTTIGGVAFRHIDRLPHVGDQVTIDGVTITVLEMDAHRISRVRVKRGEGHNGERDVAVGEPEHDSQDALRAVDDANDPAASKADLEVDNEHD